MRKIILFLAAVALLNSCSSNDTSTNLEPCTHHFQADSLQVKIHHHAIFIAVTEVRATFKYELECNSGKLHQYSLNFPQFGVTIVSFDTSNSDCSEPADMQLEKTVSVSALGHLFAGYDSVTVYFTVTGLFQRCSAGMTDSIAPISWADTVVAQVID